MEETFNPAALTRSDTMASSVTVKTSTLASATKTTKTSQSYPRIDFEPYYAELKSLIADNWETYHDALTRFIRGELSSSEFGDLCDQFLLATPSTEHAHNSLICAVIHNTGRDSPEPGPAAFISLATDKSSGPSTSKPTLPTSDASEQRLKAEIMALPARDRRRLKAITTDSSTEESAHIRATYEASYSAARIQAPAVSNSSGAGITEKNWNLEIRKRYAQPLFSESLEFPDNNTLQARIVPICYEAGLVNGAAAHCAELVGVAAETYIKTLLHDIFNRVRSNGPTYENGATGNGIFTAKYRKQVLKEDTEVKAGRLSRIRDDEMLPTESKEAQNRRQLTIADLKLANAVGPGFWNGMPMVAAKVETMLYDADFPWTERSSLANGNANGGLLGSTNGTVHNEDDEVEDEDDMDLDDDDIGWEGASRADQAALGRLLTQCLELAGEA